jgi:hypothetical protein
MLCARVAPNSVAVASREVTLNRMVGYEQRWYGIARKEAKE